MSVGDVVGFLRGGILQIFMLALPILGAALLIGLVVAIFQAVTSIQEQTLTFVPKLLVILVVLALLGPWMFSVLTNYTVNLFSSISAITR